MKKTFDAVQWMRKRRAEIDEEDRGLSWEEKHRKTHEIVMADPILAPFHSQAISPSGGLVAEAREAGTRYEAKGK